ncbi:MAG TPA: hypothetical protein VGO00_13525, partial [Kofleriaceae bacterium]|nr:hypothetical protein [Kofleriaceae bacterium]
MAAQATETTQRSSCMGLACPICMKFLAVLVVVAGCATIDDDTSDTSQATLAMPAADAAAIVAFVNYPGTDDTMLDQTIG